MPSKESARTAASSLSLYLNPEVWNVAGAIQQVSRGFAEGRLIIIRNALRSAFAERMFQCLESFSAWKLCEKYKPGSSFHFHHHNIYDEELFPPDLAWCRQIFASEETRDWITQLSGQKMRRDYCLLGELVSPRGSFAAA